MPRGTGKEGMMKRLVLFESKCIDFLRIPVSIRQEFLRESVAKNHFSLLIICAIIFVWESYNIVRVLVISQVGLGTLNNRIYFGMYCTLLAVAAAWLVLRRCLRSASPSAQWAWQYVVVWLLFLWHIALNTYDLYRDPDAGVTVFTTAILGLAILIHMAPLYTILLFGVGYLIFQLFSAPLLSAGAATNLTITFTVAAAIALISAHHTSVHLQQRLQITRINDKLQKLVELDPLTELLNKVTIERRIEGHLARMTDTGGVTLMMMDLDDFKAVNDRFGHPCGDHVLTQAAAQLRAVFPSAELGRIGGDEFAIVFPYALTQKEAEDLTCRLIRALAAIRWQGADMNILCSLGVCTCTRPDMTYKALYIQADQMLYLAKKSGKHRCCFCRITPETTECPGGAEDLPAAGNSPGALSRPISCTNTPR